MKNKYIFYFLSSYQHNITLPIHKLLPLMAGNPPSKNMNIFQLLNKKTADNWRTNLIPSLVLELFQRLLLILEGFKFKLSKAE